MSERSVAGLCRLTIRAPERLLDLALPADIPIADLLPVIVDHAGADLDEAGLEHGSWVLQRIGGAPLPTEESPQSLGLKDGETLLLRPLAAALPPVHYDDLVDAVSSAVRNLPHPWTPTFSRWTLRSIAGAALLGCLLLLALSGGSTLIRILLAVGAALVALAGAGAASRVLDDGPGGVLFGLAASAFLAVGGALVAGGHFTGAAPARATGAQLLAASAAGAVGAILALTVVTGFGAVFVATAAVAGTGVVGGLLMIGLGVPFTQAAAGVGAVALIFSAFIPMLSFSLAGLRLPPLPTNPEQLQEGIAPHSGTEIAERAADTDRWMSGLTLAVGTACLASLIGLTWHPDPAQTLTAVLTASLLLLHGRNLGTAWQRLALIVPAGLGIVVLGVQLARHHLADSRITAVVLLLFAVMLAVISWTVPGRRLLPHWGRAGDVLHMVTAVALLPAVLWTLGVYHYFRSISG